MRRESKRPSITVSWVFNCPLEIRPYEKDIVEYCKVDERGYPTLRKRGYKNKVFTVILGFRAGNVFVVTPEDKVWTCYSRAVGQLSSITNEYYDRELTVIVHDKKYTLPATSENK